MEVIVGLLSTFLRMLIIDFLVYTVFYWVGWSVCKVLTFCRYPKKTDQLNSKNRNTLVLIVGVTVSLGLFISFLYWG